MNKKKCPCCGSLADPLPGKVWHCPKCLQFIVRMAGGETRTYRSL